MKHPILTIMIGLLVGASIIAKAAPSYDQIDALGDSVVNISDAVYLIAYIFSGGAAPHCQGM